MRIHVQGLWHLGTVTAACLASVGHDVVGIDFDLNVIESLNIGKPTIFEPGLEELVNAGLNSNKLKFSSEINNIDFLWVTYDTPVDDNDNADTNFVISQIEKIMPYLNDNALVLISSQMPIGSVKFLEEKFNSICSKKINFAYSPENLRLGNALNVFLHPDRIVVGVRSEKSKILIKELLAPITDKIEWMSIESAEMTKHAINSFLATSVVFANEIAVICEMTGADAKEVERGLKSEQRIGLKAYLSPGVAFAGGTLARDIEFLKKISSEYKISTPLLESIKKSNDAHKTWSKRKIMQIYPCLKGINITIWGITYKSGTDTLRRSLTAELCNWLIEQEAKITVYDPYVNQFPLEWNGLITKSNDLKESIINCDILLIGTKNNDYDNVLKSYSAKNKLTILDPNRFIYFVDKLNSYKYISIGTPMDNK